MTEKEVEAKAYRCDYCEKRITYSQDIISVERCVLGPNGVIPLGEVLTFCTDACVSRYFNHDPVSDLPPIPRRIP